ncbi:dihydroorotase [Maledivibacter halophilus]|uniref:Dihydropyrimidinase n=1 Tax=Maledivibacter halophilus TaxID=36842 RepID=A0A1T5I9Z9_9FIRM|nr:amidohydrolase family protein [Maledivibacter halophilus]SKC36005.1 dihydropyrimidinase [Maledivibacter halophilus]
MERDIFSSYIKSQISSDRREEEKAYSSEQISWEEDRESLNILREISSKLDKLDKFTLSQPVAGTSIAFPQSQTMIQNPSNIDIAIINGIVVLPDNGIFNMNVYIKDGKIHSIGRNDSIKAAKTIDATGKYVIPGIIDPHVHLGLFAPLKTELVTETKSALMGGVTTIGCYFGGPQSHFTSFPQIMEDAKRLSYIDIIPHLVIANDEQKSEIQDYIQHLGITSFKIYMNGIPGLIPDVDDGFILDVLEEIKKSNKDCILCSHAENRYIVRRASARIRAEKGENATVLDFTDTHPDMAEEEAVMRLSYLAEKSRVPVYFVHMSSKAAIERLRNIKPKNKYVHVETTSPYLSITKQGIKGNEFKMEPPFRDVEDMEELWKAVEDGIVDTIGTDNVTQTRKEKNNDGPMWEAIAGYPALETHLTSVLTEGVVKRGIPIEKIISHMTKKPAEIFGVYPKKGTILPRSDADVVIVDINTAKEVRAHQLNSRSDFSIFEGRRLQGWPVTTIKNGEIVVENGVFVANHSTGKCLSR